MFGLKWTWWRWETSVCARIDMVEADGKCSSQWRWETSVCARIDMVEADGERLSLNGHGGGGGVWAPMDMMEVGDERSGSI